MKKKKSKAKQAPQPGRSTETQDRTRLCRTLLALSHAAGLQATEVVIEDEVPGEWNVAVVAANFIQMSLAERARVLSALQGMRILPSAQGLTVRVIGVLQNGHVYYGPDECV